MTELRLRTAKLQWVETDGEVIALDESTLMYLSANGTGAFLWRELAAGTKREDLIERLASRYGVDSEIAARDVDDFLAQLDARGLLES